jgi:hypothetical protein
VALDSAPVRVNARPGMLVEARHVVLPDGATKTLVGRFIDSVGKLGIRYDRWQEDLIRSLSAMRGEKWAARTAVISIPRQVGKTFLVGTLAFARCRETPGLTVVWTAHRFKVARETFQFLRGLAMLPNSGVPSEDYITTAAGNETIRFNNGSRIVFAARERGAIRGFSNVGLLVLDVAQILTDSALGDLKPITNRASNPQTIMMGTPPRPQDPGEAFTRLRKAALEGVSGRSFYVEFSADRDAESDDRRAWRDANPSYPQHTPDEALEDLLTSLAPDDFRREVLGIWDDDGAQWVIPADAWEAAVDTRGRDMSLPVAFGIDVSPSRSSAAIAAAYILDDETWRVEVVRTGLGTDWIVPWLSDPARVVQPLVTALDAGGPAGSLVQDLVAARVRPLLKCSAADLKAACGQFYDGIMSGSLKHLGDPVLTEALAGAERRQLLDAWAWSRKDSGADITPLVAATLAAYGLSAKRRRATGARPNRGLVVMR